MPDKTDEPAAKSPTRRERRRRQRELIDKIVGEALPVLPRLSIGGRPRSLDPDQATLDATIKTIVNCGMVNSTREEVAANLGVTPETLKDFFVRYPEAEAKFEDARLVGLSSLRINQFKQSQTSPQMAMWLGRQHLGQIEPADATRARQKEVELDLRRRAVEAQEKMVAMRSPADLGSGLPIDIGSLSLQQLLQLATRIRLALQQQGGLTGAQIIAPATEAEPKKAG